MNEVSQGVSGNMEYVEFIVVDTTVVYSCTSTTPPCIDIRGWIFDDNSGYHGSVGIAPGCVRFSYDPLWSCVPMGTIIVIYNGADVNPQLPADDVSLTDGNCTIIAPINDPQLFESNTTTPGDVACSYPATGWTPGGNWSNTLLANSGDCARIVDLSGCEVFSVCWTSANQNAMVYFSSGATSGTSSTNTVYYFNDGNPSNGTNWTIGCADVPACGQEDQTPGAPNNAANAAFIAQYNNNCSPITPIVANAVVDANAGCSCTGQASAFGSGSIAGYTYEWLDAAFAPIGQTSATATGLCGGTYYVVVTSSIGCPDTATVTITSSGGTSVSVNSETICNGQSATLTAIPSLSGGTFSWSPGGQTTASITVSPSATTTYTVSYDLGGCISTASGIVSVNPTYTLTESITVCENTLVTYPDGTNETITSGTSHTSNLTTLSGCDSIIVTTVTMNPLYNLTENINACENSTVVYPDGTSETVTTNASHTSNLTTLSGCDSIIVTNVTVNPLYNITENISVCANTLVTYPDGTSETITASTSHTSNLTSVSGCDSIVVTNVALNPSYNTVESISLCSGSNFTYPDGVSSVNIAANESHVSSLVTVAGCDSIITTNITITSTIAISQNVSVCSGDSYTYPDGTVSVNITTGESHTSSFTTTTGCDSLVTVNVSVNPIYNVTEVISVCEGSTVTYPDGASETITVNTSHTSNLTTVAGCDSIVVTNVVMNPVYNLTENVTACENGSVTYPDGTVATITASTSYTSNLTSAMGCDSIITTNVTMNPVYSLTEDIAVCENSSVTYPDGTTEIVTGNTAHTSNLIASTGCDSVVVTNVTVQSVYNITENITACENSSVTYPDGVSEVITANTSHTSNLITAVGCDSIITTNVIMNPVYNVTEDITVCEGSTVTYPDGISEVIIAATSHTSNLLSVNGCDSTIVTNVQMAPLYNGSEIVNTCEGSWVTYPDGTTEEVSSPVTHVSVLTSANGCDSVITTVISVNPVYNLSEDVQICSGEDYTYPDGTVSTDIVVSEVHTSNFLTTQGCDSIIVTNVNVVGPPVVDAGTNITICEGEQVTLTASGAQSYLWSNGVLNGQSFVPSGTTTYQVVGTDGYGCTDTAQITVTVGPIPELNLVVDVPTGCAPLTVQLTNTAGAQGTSVWELGNGVTMTGSSVFYTYNTPGIFDIVLTVANDYGCTNSMTYGSLITVAEPPLAGFTSSETNISTLDPEVHFINTSVNAVDYLWIFPDSTTSNEVNPDFFFSDQTSGFYITTLIAYNEFGCPDTAYLYVTLEEELIFYVPNTFTPDADEFNQVFLPVFSSGYDPNDYKLLIFNRWGEVVFESNDTAVGWDGTYAGQYHVQDGTYIWRLEFKVNKNDERKMFTGHVNVLR